MTLNLTYITAPGGRGMPMPPFPGPNGMPPLPGGLPFPPPGGLPFPPPGGLPTIPPNFQFPQGGPPMPPGGFQGIPPPFQQNGNGQNSGRDVYSDRR
jgi:U1 small nuclear ribonucleoprotein C